MQFLLLRGSLLPSGCWKILPKEVTNLRPAFLCSKHEALLLKGQKNLFCEGSYQNGSRCASALSIQFCKMLSPGSQLHQKGVNFMVCHRVKCFFSVRIFSGANSEEAASSKQE